MKFYVYYHNDFDGMAAAAIFAKFLYLKDNISFEEFVFRSVDYNLQKIWANHKLQNPCAVIDFLFHPQSDWWFDHHSTSFQNETLKSLYVKSEKKKKNWDTNFQSCPSLLISHFKKYYPGISFLKEHYKKLIEWSDIIDSAKYDSPAVLFDYDNFDNPYININRTLAVIHDEEYYNLVLETFYFSNLDLLLKSKKYLRAIDLVRKGNEEAVKTIKKIIKIEGKIAFFDQSSYEFPFQRYLAYYLFPSVRYRIGIFRKNGHYSVSINYNAWAPEENKVNLGELCTHLGGGGRFNVGAILEDTHKKAIQDAISLKKMLTDSLAKVYKCSVS